MRPVQAVREDGREQQETTTNEVVEAFISWRQDLEQYVDTQDDHRELAVLAVELEDQLKYGLAYVEGEIKQRVRELND